MEDIQEDSQDLEKLDEKVEEEALEEKSEDEIRSEIIEKHGLDEVTDDSLIEDMVTDNLKMRKELSIAIKQKRNWREKAQSLEKAKPAKPQAESQTETQTQSFNKDDIDKLLDEKLQERDLDQAQVTDDVKSEVKAYAKAKGITYREALNSSYIQFLQDKESVNTKNDKASIGGSRSVTVKRNYDEIQPEQVKNLDSESFKNYMEWLKSQ